MRGKGRKEGRRGMERKIIEAEYLSLPFYHQDYPTFSNSRERREEIKGGRKVEDKGMVWTVLKDLAVF